MPRHPRHLTHVPGALVHVIVRFVDGRFLLDDPARARYLALLARALRASDWRLIAYAMMSSHVHLAFLAGAAELRSWAHSVHIRFAHWINRCVAEGNPKPLGHVIADRPTTIVMCPSRARFLTTYLHRNPVEAGVVADPADSSWTSHRAYLGLERCEGGLDLALGFELAGFDATPQGRQAFHEFVSRTEVSFADLGVRDVEAQAPPAPRGVSPMAVIEAVSTALQVPKDELLGRSRRAPVVLARRVALVVWAQHALSMLPMAKALGISPSAVSRLLGRPHDTAQVRAAANQTLVALGEAAARAEPVSQLVYIAPPLARAS